MSASPAFFVPFRTFMKVLVYRNCFKREALPFMLKPTRKFSSLPGQSINEKAKKISVAMKAYLERARKHDKFLAEEIAEYEVGKRHLANIMGEDHDNFTQEDIDKAIRYLLPSGVFDKKARPMMKHPTLVIPKRKAAQFGEDGRPYHWMFYTGKPLYSETLHDISLKIENLNNFLKKFNSSGKPNTTEKKLNMLGSTWLDKKKIEDRFQDKLTDKEFNSLIYMLEQLAGKEYSEKEAEFIMSFRIQHITESKPEDVPKPIEAENGRRYIQCDGERKTAKAQVKIWSDGSGKILINNKHILDEFPDIMEREQLLFPLQFTDMLGKVDIEVEVTGGGESGRAGATRLAIARALRSFVSKETILQMRIAGLLTADPRKHERKKPGQKGARAKYTWKKR